MKRTPIGLALVALLTLSTVPARGATLTLRDGSQVNGEIRGVVVQRLSVQHLLTEKGLRIEQHLYASTRGPDLVRADEEGLVRSRAVAGQLMTTTRRALEVEGDGSGHGPRSGPSPTTRPSSPRP